MQFPSLNSTGRQGVALADRNRELEEQLAERNRELARASEETRNSSVWSARAPDSAPVTLSPRCSIQETTQQTILEEFRDAAGLRAALYESRQRTATLEREKTLLQARLLSPAPQALTVLSRAVTLPPSVTKGGLEPTMTPSSLVETQLQLRVDAQAAEIQRLEARLARLSKVNALHQADNQRRTHTVKLSLSRLKKQQQNDARIAREQLAAMRSEAERVVRVLSDKLKDLMSMKATMTADKDAEGLVAYQAQAQAQASLLASLRSAVDEELAALSHSAHVKDLGRIAALRELQLSTEGMSSDAMFAREVHQILVFGCQAAENALAESQPAVVAKLREARATRLAAAERVLASARKDLDQRSLETVNSAALQLAAFQAKASKRLNSCKQRSQELWGRLSAYAAAAGAGAGGGEV